MNERSAFWVFRPTSRMETLTTLDSESVENFDNFRSSLKSGVIRKINDKHMCMCIAMSRKQPGITNAERKP